MRDLFLGALTISLAPIFVKLLDGVGPALIGAWRTGIAFLVLLPGVLIASRRRGSYRREGVCWIVAAGAFFGLDLFLWHQSIGLVGAGLATILANTQVLYLSTLGVVRGEVRPDSRFLAAIVSAGVGIVLLLGAGRTVGVDSVAQARGLVLGLLTGLCYASFVFTLRKAGESQGGPAESLCYTSLVSSLVMFGISFAEGETMSWSLPNLINLAGLGAFVHVAGWYLISRGLARIPASRAGLILLMQPFGATILGALIFGERLSALQGTGAVLTLLGIGLESTRRRLA